MKLPVGFLQCSNQRLVRGRFYRPRVLTNIAFNILMVDNFPMAENTRPLFTVRSIPSTDRRPLISDTSEAAEIEWAGSSSNLDSASDDLKIRGKDSLQTTQAHCPFSQAWQPSSNGHRARQWFEEPYRAHHPLRVQTKLLNELQSLSLQSRILSASRRKSFYFGPQHHN